MAKTSILLKMGLDTSKLKASLANAGKSVGGFASTAMDKLSSVAKLASGALVGGFIAAAKSALSYGREMNNLAKLSGESFENFQALAGGAKKVGIENSKLGDIFKDVNDKIGDFIQTGGGPMKDFFENIAPQIGVTAEQFKNLSGKDALQLYYDSLEKVNLSNQDMTFYMEAIASDATALIPLLKNGGKAWAEYADEMRKAGLVMDEETRVALEDSQEELDKFGVKATIVAGTVVKNFRTLNLVGFQPTTKELERMHERLTKAPADAGRAMADSIRALTENLSKFTSETSSSMSSFVKETTIDQITKIEAVTEADRKAKAKREKIQKELGKIDEKIANERQKRIALDQTATEALAAAEKKRLDAAVALQVAASSGDELKAKKAQLVYAEALTDEAKARKTVKDGIVKQDKEIAGLLKKGSELSAVIALQVIKESKERGLVSEQVKLQGELKDAIARGDLEAVKTNEKALEIEEQILQVINDHNVTRPEAVAHVKALMAEEQKLIDEKENAAAQEKAQKEKMLDLERQLVDAQASGNDGLAREIQNRIDKEQMALDLMDKLGISIDEAREKAEKLAAVNAGPDLNQSGFVTPGEQRKFDRQQKERQKQQDEINDLEERDERERGGGIPNISRDKRKTGTVRERMEADREQKIRTRENKALGKIDRDQKLNEEQKRAAINEILEARNKRIQKNKPKGEEPKGEEPKVGGPLLGPDGKPVDANGNHMGPGGVMVGPNGQPLGEDGKPVPGGGGGEGPKEPKKPEQLIVDKLGTKLDDIKTELEKIEKHLQC